MNINAIVGSPSAPLEHCRVRAPLLAGVAALLLTATAVCAPADAPVTKSDFKSIDVFDLQWVSDPQIAPDGRNIAYVRMSMDIKTDRPQRAIWLTGIDGKNTRPLGATASSMPRWSPDGTRIAYLSAASDGSTQLFVYWSGSNYPPRSVISRNRQRASPGLRMAAGSSDARCGRSRTRVPR
jgi:WD40-like Beta Propeller Repeat